MGLIYRIELGETDGNVLAESGKVEVGEELAEDNTLEASEVRKGVLVERPAGAHSEPYAPLPGWNNRSCTCAVVSVLSVLGIFERAVNPVSATAA